MTLIINLQERREQAPLIVWTALRWVVEQGNCVVWVCAPSNARARELLAQADLFASAEYFAERFTICGTAPKKVRQAQGVFYARVRNGAIEIVELTTKSQRPGR